MSRPNTLEVIVISDSDPDDNLQPSTSSVSLVNSIAGSSGATNSNATSSGHPATLRGRSEPTLHATGLGPHAEMQIRQRQTRSLPHAVIDVDADDPSDIDGPSVSFQITPFVLHRMRQANQQPSIQPKRARTDQLPPPLPRPETKIDIRAWDRDLNYEYGNKGAGAETCIIPKVAYGSAVELGYIVPPRTGRKDITA